jgi:hypothetical protein
MLQGLKVRGVKMKKNEKKCVLQFEKNLLSLQLFWAGPLALPFKDNL